MPVSESESSEDDEEKAVGAAREERENGAIRLTENSSSTNVLQDRLNGKNFTTESRTTGSGFLDMTNASSKMLLPSTNMSKDNNLLDQVNEENDTL